MNESRKMGFFPMEKTGLVKTGLWRGNFEVSITEGVKANPKISHESGPWYASSARVRSTGDALIMWTGDGQIKEWAGYPGRAVLLRIQGQMKLAKFISHWGGSGTIVILLDADFKPILRKMKAAWDSWGRYGKLRSKYQRLAAKGKRAASGRASYYAGLQKKEEVILASLEF